MTLEKLEKIREKIANRDLVGWNGEDAREVILEDIDAAIAEERAKNKPCQHCHGEGFTAEHNMAPDAHGPGGECLGGCPVQVQCEHCEGTGIEPTTEERAKPECRGNECESFDCEVCDSRKPESAKPEPADVVETSDPVVAASWLDKEVEADRAFDDDEQPRDYTDDGVIDLPIRGKLSAVFREGAWIDETAVEWPLRLMRAADVRRKIEEAGK